MKQNWLIHDNIGSVKGGTGWFLVVLGKSNLVLCQTNLVLIGIKWNWVSTRLLCLYILKKGIFGQTDSQTTRYCYSACIMFKI